MAAFVASGCIHHPDDPGRITPPPQVQTGGVSGVLKGIGLTITHPLSILPLPRGRPPAPKAIPLMRIGTVRSYSPEGNYAIVELLPGSTVREGDRLIITNPSDGESVRLKVGEVRYPCFDADVEKGTPTPGDVVQE